MSTELIVFFTVYGSLSLAACIAGAVWSAGKYKGDVLWAGLSGFICALGWPILAPMLLIGWVGISVRRFFD